MPPRAFASLRSPRERGAPLSESPVGGQIDRLCCKESWSGKGDLNPRPSPWQGDALPLSYSRSLEGGEFLILVRVYYPVKKTRCRREGGQKLPWFLPVRHSFSLKL